MRTFSQGQVARAVAHILTVAFCWSIALTGLAGLPAGAQVATSPSYSGSSAGTTFSSTGGAAGQTVAVLPFENRTGYRSDTFGQEASDAVATELRDRLMLTVWPKADVELQLRDLGYKPPFTDAELVRLATELEVVLLITGQVRRARIVLGREGRYAEVELAALLFDRMAQTTVNGAVVAARSPSSTEASDDTLMSRALQQAAFDAVQQMRTRPSVTAMVLWARDNTVFLNVGGRAGLENGMRMVAIRGGQRIGMVEITEANPIGSYARPIGGAPLRTGDQLRAIYEMPTKIGAPSAARLSAQKKNMTTFVLAAAALLGLGELGSTARLLEQGNIAAPGFAASNLANGDEFGYSVAIGSPVVLVTWDQYSGTEKNRIGAYEVVRAGGILAEIMDVILQDEIQAQNHYVDTGGPGNVVVTVTLTVNADGTFGYSRTSDTFTDPPATGITITPTQITWVFIPLPLFPGLPYTYRLRPWTIIQVQLSPGVYQWQFDTNPVYSSSSQNYLTAVAPPFAAGVFIDGTLATFQFYNPIGADEAIIQIARDPYNDFAPANIYQQNIPGTWTSGALFGVQTVQVDLNALASLPGSPTILWWRVGARNRQDAVAPRPYPLTRTNDYGWVFSERQRLILFASASRASLIHKQREAIRMNAVGRSRDSHGGVPPDRPGRVTGDRRVRPH